MLQTYKKPLIIIVIVVGILFLTVFGINKWKQHTMATLIIDAAPSDLTMHIESRDIKSPTRLFLQPGTYALSFSRQDFSNVKQTVTIQKGKSTTVYMALTPTTDAGRAYVRSHPQLQRDLERIGGKQYNQHVVAITDKNPLIKYLPSGGINFKIDYTAGSGNQSDKVFITVKHVGDLGKQQAQQWIRDKGLKPEDYTIQYIDLAAPGYQDVD